jgi:DNA-binding CsgD family transcriptional regulator
MDRTTRLVHRRREPSPLDGLIDREREALGVIAEGRSNQSIRQCPFLSPKAVEAHVRQIVPKLRLRGITSTVGPAYRTLSDGS